MNFSKVLKVVLLLSLLALVFPLSAIHGQTPVGTAVARGSAPGLSDMLVVDLDKLPALSENEAYEGWLISDDGSTMLSVGVLAFNEGGTVTHTYTHPAGMNLVTAFDKFAITIEASPDTDAAPSDITAYMDMIPAEGLVHIRALVDSQSGSTVNLVAQANVALLHAGLAMDSTTLADVQAHAGHIINIIEGMDGPNYTAAGGTFGDGSGIAAHATKARMDAAAAMATMPTNSTFHTYEAHVSASSANVVAWANEARDMALLAKGSESLTVARAFVSNTTSLLERAVSGWDADRDGTVESVANEGGAMQAHMAAQNMATYHPATPVAEPPATGDISFGVMALMALAAGAVLVLGGSAFVRRGRAQA